ncbi:deoxyhypusine hydroxylase-like [Silene latifolia]|uniref:deoxyhypusine hydroxylase-like n=1 Tax=Silene latifolia TaxID=37657 RepID=UPI003D7771D2
MNPTATITLHPRPKSLSSDPAPEVRESCELDLHRIEEMKNTDSNDRRASSYLSVDPAAPASCISFSDLRGMPLDEDKRMYKRYAALFALRNQGGDEAISAIVDSLSANSALLRHEPSNGRSTTLPIRQ